VTFGGYRFVVGGLSLIFDAIRTGRGSLFMLGAYFGAITGVLACR
jgi:hypothetical protein